VAMLIVSKQDIFMLGLAGYIPILSFVLSVAVFHVFARIIFSVMCLPQIQLYNDQLIAKQNMHQFTSLLILNFSIAHCSCHARHGGRYCQSVFQGS
jgi:hypothetical protein